MDADLPKVKEALAKLRVDLRQMEDDIDAAPLPMPGGFIMSSTFPQPTTAERTENLAR